VQGIPRRIVPENKHLTMFSGLTEYILTDNIKFVNVGERCNISGSILFKNMIVKGDYEKAVVVCKQ
jgi:5-methyltetrahydrofolate--homocysteine methyltransferase